MEQLSTLRDMEMVITLPCPCADTEGLKCKRSGHQPRNADQRLNAIEWDDRSAQFSRDFEAKPNPE